MEKIFERGRSLAPKLAREARVTAPSSHVGISAVRGNAQLKLTRLHYVRGTVAEARATCRANHS